MVFVKTWIIYRSRGHTYWSTTTCIYSSAKNLRKQENAGNFYITSRFRWMKMHPPIRMVKLGERSQNWPEKNIDVLDFGHSRDQSIISGCSGLGFTMIGGIFYGNIQVEFFPTDQKLTIRLWKSFKKARMKKESSCPTTIFLQDDCLKGEVNNQCGVNWG